MKTVCICGFEYGDFVAHHQIPAGAKFNCPGCDTELLTEVTPSASKPDAPRAVTDTALEHAGAA